MSWPLFWHLWHFCGCLHRFVIRGSLKVDGELELTWPAACSVSTWVIFPCTCILLAVFLHGVVCKRSIFLAFPPSPPQVLGFLSGGSIIYLFLSIPLSHCVWVWWVFLWGVGIEGVGACGWVVGWDRPVWCLNALGCNHSCSPLTPWGTWPPLAMRALINQTDQVINVFYKESSIVRCTCYIHWKPSA